MRQNFKVLKPADEMEMALANWDALIKRADRAAYAAFAGLLLLSLALVTWPEWFNAVITAGLEWLR